MIHLCVARDPESEEAKTQETHRLATLEEVAGWMVELSDEDRDKLHALEIAKGSE